MPHDIFVSYSRRNLVAVKSLKDGLERLGFSCWMDLQGIESGTWEFSDHIIAAIDASTAVLFFLSNDSQTSAWALKEIGYARDEKKHVVLVRFNDDPLTKKFRFEFGRSDIIDWRIPEQKEKLLRDLREWTGKSQPGGPPSQVSGQGTSSSRTGGLVECPVCGKKNRPEETFHCRECGRDNLCLRHQDEETFLCRDCVAKKKKSRDAAAERAGSRSERESLRRIPENLVKKAEEKTASFLVKMAEKKAESVLSQIKCRKARNVKGYFEVKMSMVSEPGTTAVAEFVQKLSGTDLSIARNLVEKHRVIAQGLTEEEAENVKSVLQILGADAIVRKQAAKPAVVAERELGKRISQKRDTPKTRKNDACRTSTTENDGDCEVAIIAVPARNEKNVVATVTKLSGRSVEDATHIVRRHGIVKTGLSVREAEEIAQTLKNAGAGAVVRNGEGKTIFVPKSKSFDGNGGGATGSRKQTDSEEIRKLGEETCLRLFTTKLPPISAEQVDEWARDFVRKRNSLLLAHNRKPNGRYSETVDGLTWNYEVKDGEVILGASDNDWSEHRLALSDKLDGPFSVVIPALLGGCPVTTIGDLSFCHCVGLSAVTIPDGVTKIGEGAFSGCSGLQSVTIPKSATDIRCRAFRKCSGLKSVTLPHGMTRIDQDVFEKCSGLTSVIIPDGVTRIDWHAFEDCSGLTTVIIPGSVTEIGKGAFCRCNNLAAVTIPDGMNSIETAAFFGCDNLDDQTKRLLKARWPRSLEGSTPKPISAAEFRKLYEAAEAKRASQKAGQSSDPSRKSAKKGWSFWSW